MQVFGKLFKSQNKTGIFLLKLFQSQKNKSLLQLRLSIKK